VCLAGCVSLDAIREQDYSQVTTEAVEAAAGSEDARVVAGLAGLLDARRDGSSNVDANLAAEAVVSLRRTGSRDALPALLRAARGDPDEEVRFLALDACAAIDRSAALKACEESAAADPSELVRERARALLAR
jgi:HEAT repeat protein